LKAKKVFSDVFLDTLPNPSDKILMKKIKILGVANLPQKDREEVCFLQEICPIHYYFLITVLMVNLLD